MFFLFVLFPSHDQKEEIVNDLNNVKPVKVGWWNEKGRKSKRKIKRFKWFIKGKINHLSTIQKEKTRIRVVLKMHPIKIYKEFLKKTLKVEDKVENFNNLFLTKYKLPTDKVIQDQTRGKIKWNQ